MSYVRRETPISADLPILFNQSKSHTPFAATMNGDYVRPDAEGRQWVPAGMFVCRYDEVTRYLPRVELIANAPVGSTTLRLGVTHRVIVPGDALYTVEPYGVIQITGVYEPTDFIRLELDGYRFDYQVNQISNTVIAQNMASAITKNPALSKRVYATSNANSIYVYSKTGIAYSYNLSTLNSTKTAPSNAGLVSPTSATNFYNTDTFIGVVDYITPEGVCTLKAPTTVAQVAGAKIGVPVTELIGVDIHSRDFQYRPIQNIAPYYKAIGVYETNLPYVDWHIKRELSDLNIRTRF